MVNLPPAPAPAPLAYTVRDAALALGVSERVIRDYINTGHLPVRFVGTKPIIPADGLREFLDDLPDEPHARSK